jgi:regulator of PEP synthase PpsR (kinase-PPPase family)
MRQYVNKSQSGTISSSTRKEVDKLEPIIDRVMLVAKRLSTAEEELNKCVEKIGNFESTIRALEFKVKMQDEKIQEFIAQAEVPTAKPPVRRTSTKTK